MLIAGSTPCFGHRVSTQQALSSVVTCIHAYRSFCPSPAEHRRAENTSACHRPYVSDPHRAPQPPPLAPLPAQDYSAPARPSFLDSRPASQWDTPDATDSASPPSSPRSSSGADSLHCQSTKHRGSCSAAGSSASSRRTFLCHAMPGPTAQHPKSLPARSWDRYCLESLLPTAFARRARPGRLLCRRASTWIRNSNGSLCTAPNDAARWEKERTTCWSSRAPNSFETVCARLGTEQTF